MANKKKISLTANNVTVPSTAALCLGGVTVTVPTSGYRIKYSTAENGIYSDTVPSLPSASSQTSINIYYKVTATGYTTKTGSYTCTLSSIIAGGNGGTETTCGEGENQELIDGECVCKDGYVMNVKGDTCIEVPDSKENYSEFLQSICESGTYTKGSYPNSSSFYCTETGTDLTKACEAVNGATASNVYCRFCDEYEIADCGDEKCTVCKFKESIEVDVTEKTHTYDGRAKQCSGGVSVTNPSSGATVLYKSGSDADYHGLAISYIDTGTYTINYKVSADGYADLTGSYTCTINPGTIQASAEDITVYTVASSCNNVNVTVPIGGYDIKYSTSGNEGTYTLSNAQTVSTSDPEITVYYQVTATGYTTKTGSYTCTLSSIIAGGTGGTETTCDSSTPYYISALNMCVDEEEFSNWSTSLTSSCETSGGTPDLFAIGMLMGGYGYTYGFACDGMDETTLETECVSAGGDYYSGECRYTYCGNHSGFSGNACVCDSGYSDNDGNIINGCETKNTATTCEEALQTACSEYGNYTLYGSSSNGYYCRKEAAATFADISDACLSTLCNGEYTENKCLVQ